MPRQPVTRDTSMVELMGHALAEAEGANFNDNAARYRGLALAALKPLARPTEAMIDAAYEAVWFDAQWAINNRRDFARAVRAMITAAINEGAPRNR